MRDALHILSRLHCVYPKMVMGGVIWHPHVVSASRYLDANVEELVGFKWSRGRRVPSAGPARFICTLFLERKLPSHAAVSELDAAPTRSPTSRLWSRPPGLVYPDPGPTPAASAEETETILRWLESPGVRLVRVDGGWSLPAFGAARLKGRIDRAYDQEVPAQRERADRCDRLGPSERSTLWSPRSCTSRPTRRPDLRGRPGDRRARGRQRGLLDHRRVRPDGHGPGRPLRVEIAEVVPGRLNKIEGVRATDTHIAFRTYSRHDLEAAFSIGLPDAD